MKTCQSTLLCVFSLLSLMFGGGPNECAAWENVVNVCVASNTQANFILQKIGDDYLVCWEDSRRTGYKDIYGQIFDNSSNVSWTADGNSLVVAGAVVASRTNYDSLSTIFLAPNGASKFFLAWMEGTDSRDLNCYINCYNVSASPQWGEAGITVQAGNSGTSASMATDGESGVFASWYFGGWSLWYDRTRAAHFDSEGNVAMAYGSMSDDSGGNGPPANDSRMTYISPGVAIIAWKDNENGAYSGWKSLRAQKLDSTGRAWGGIGVRLSLAPTVVTNIVGSYDVVADGNGGIIGVWNDQRYGNNHIFAQLVNGSGSIQWGTGGMAVCTASGTQSDPRLISDGSGGAVFVWEDQRDNARQIYAQHFNSSGQAQWASDGVQVSSIRGSNPRIIRAGDGNYIILWADNDSNGGTTDELRTQKINSSAEKLWSTNGVIITEATTSAPGEYEIASDSAGGAIVVWKDGRSGSYDIYAQRVFSDGYLFNISTYTPVANDFDGDAKADPAVMESSGNWYIWFSGSGYAMGGPYALGITGTAVSADFDGDQLADPAVMNSSGTWYICFSGTGYQAGGPYALGVSGTPVADDFDGDGRADPAVMESSGNWYIWFSGSGYPVGGPYALGVAGTAVSADFDGDGLADPAVMNSSSNWYICFSGTGYQAGGPYALGQAGTPVAGDFDGDGKADPAVVDSSEDWYIWMSGSGYVKGGPYVLTH